MAKCWTCGTTVNNASYTCSTCESLSAIKNLREAVESHSNDLHRLELKQQQEFLKLNETLSAGLEEVASAMEWGFQEISWQLHQQTSVLKRIDYALRNQSEIQANDWRRQAEELRRRGVLKESEEFFLKALNVYRLDYRIYVGLAETYLRMNSFDNALIYLEKSLYHAPKENDFDWRSNSYRLIGHIYACWESYSQARTALESSIELSPRYAEGHYDYAQYCSRVGVKDKCLNALNSAISLKPSFWYLAHKERNFEPKRNEVSKLLLSYSTMAYNTLKEKITESELAFKEAREEYIRAEEALIISKDKSTLRSKDLINIAEDKLKRSKRSLELGNYGSYLRAIPVAEQAYEDAKNVIDTARQERKHFKSRHTEKVRKARNQYPNIIIYPIFYGILYTIIVGLLGSIVGSIFNLDMSTHPRDTKLWEFAFLGGGFLIGFTIGLKKALTSIKKELE